MAPALIHQQEAKHPCSDAGDSTCKKTRTIGATAFDGSTAFTDDGPAAFSDDVSCHSMGNPTPHQPPQIPMLQRSRSSRPQASTLMSLFPPLQMLRPTCQKLTSMPSLPSKAGSLRRKQVVGTLYGPRRGRAIFAVQDDPSADEPLLLLKLAVATGHLIKEMASGTVRILLECERQPLDAKKENKKEKKEQNHQANQSPPPAPAPGVALWEQPVWTMFCNGRRTGCAAQRPCGEPDRQVLRAVRAVSAGAGVLPPLPAPLSAPLLEKGKKAATGCSHGGRGSCCRSTDGAGGNQEVMYMRARFERVVVSKHSEAFYMMSPSGSKAGSPELCIFLMRS